MSRALLLPASPGLRDRSADHLTSCAIVSLGADEAAARIQSLDRSRCCDDASSLVEEQDSIVSMIVHTGATLWVSIDRGLSFEFRWGRRRLDDSSLKDVQGHRTAIR
jgi:hypothetical protein